MINGFLSVIGCMYAGLKIFIEDYTKTEETNYNKSEAIKNNKHIYYDGTHVLRSTKTNEKITPVFRNGYTKYVGVQTGTIYKDTINDDNEKLKDKRKRYIYKEYPRGKFGKKIWKYDTEKKLPFQVVWHGPQFGVWKSYIIIYYYCDVGEYGEVKDVSGKIITRTIYDDDPDYDGFL